MILIRRYNKLFKTSYIVAHNISDLCNKHNSLSSKVKIPIHICNLENVKTLNYCTNVKDIQSIQFKERLLYQSIKNHNVNLKMITSIIEDLENTVCNIPETLSLKLLNCCGHALYNEPSQIRQELANRVWNFLKNMSCNLTINHYHALLQTYIDNDYRIDPQEFLKSMKIKPNNDTYCLLLQVLPNISDCAVLESLIANICKVDLHYDEKIYNALVYAYAINGNTEKAKDIIKLMEEKYIEPSATTYMYLMYAFARNNETEFLIDTLVTHKPPMTHIMKLITFLSLSGSGIHIPNILTWLKPLTVEDYSVISVIVQLVHSGHYLDAYNVVTHIPISDTAQHIKKTFALYFLEEMIKLNVDQMVILQFINDFATKQCILDIWEEAASLSLKRTNETVAIAIFNKMKKSGVSINCDCFWPLILDENVDDQEIHIYSIIKHMIALDVKIDFKTLIDYIFPYIDTSNLVATVAKLQWNGLSTKEVIEPFALFLLNSGRVKDGSFVCYHFKKKINCGECLDSLYFYYTKSGDIISCIDFLFNKTYNSRGFASIFLKKLLDHSGHSTTDFDNVTQFLIAMKYYKALIPPDDVQYIQQQIVNADFPTKDQSLKLILTMIATKADNYSIEGLIHPSYMTPNELYLHFHELKSDGKNTRGVLRKLLMTFCNNNDTRLNEILQEIHHNNFDWTAGMKLCLFNYYVRNKMISEASLTLREVQSTFPEFQIDSFKIVEYTVLLTEHDKIDEALNVLNTCNINNKPNAMKAINNLLNMLIKKDTSDYTNKIISVLVKRNYCKNAHIIFRYLILLHIGRDDIKSAVNVFTDCVKIYKKTTATVDLLVKILNSIPDSVSDSVSENWVLLENVYDLIIKIHGKEKANVNLAIAFGLTNNMEKLQHLLKENYISVFDFRKQMEFLSDDNIITVTLRILESTKNTKNINLEPICQLALNICDKRDDYKHALELEKWRKEKDIKCNADFNRTLSRLLKLNLQFSNVTSGNQ